MKGIIIINPYRIPKESVYQAERLKEEFNNLGVNVDIIDDGYLKAEIADGKLNSSLLLNDFAVYLDKDKYLSLILEKLGLKLFNSHNAIRTCDDKGETYIALANHGIDIPKTILGGLCYSSSCALSEGTADKIIISLGLPVIVKESYGSMGKGVYLAKSKEELLSIMEEVKLKPHLFQEYLPYKKGVDIRVIVIGGKAVASMERKNDSDFRSNVARGGSCKSIELPQSFKQTAEKVANILGLDYCGVDLLFGKDGKPFVCEVNSNAFIGGIEQATGINVAKLYAEYIINNIKQV
jgi:ribosomal protein S6--L-glutamate ligase/gamma-F420-2:alpha-L-glutamate ligase